jgi:hypothetical protein
VELGGGFQLPVLRPVDGLERQLQDRFIHREDAPEAEPGKAVLVEADENPGKDSDNRRRSSQKSFSATAGFFVR